MTLGLEDLARVRERLSHLRNDIPVVDLDQVRDVVLIASSSRGGSSMFTEMLRHSTGLLHLQAELNPFLVLAGLGWPHSGMNSDRLNEENLGPAAREILAAELGRELGRRSVGPIDRTRLARDLCWRLTVQWPGIDCSLSKIRGWVDEVLHELSPDPLGENLDLEALHLGLIRRIRREHPVVNPWFYDIDPRRVRATFPDIPEPQGPPSDAIIEEPPFILAGPWLGASARDVAERPLVIKTPSNAYRLPFFTALFPRARIRILHLTRNPAAAINGLLDGWRYRGFHAHRLEESLHVSGYTDQRPDDAHWWKYDLAPGWEKFRNQSLGHICAHQWASAHEAILDHLEHSDQSRFRIRFEDLLVNEQTRHQTFLALFSWLGVELDAQMDRIIAQGIPPIMATSRPRQCRWYERAGLLEPLISTPRIQALARRLGYGEPDTWT